MLKGLEVCLGYLVLLILLWAKYRSKKLLDLPVLNRLDYLCTQSITNCALSLLASMAKHQWNTELQKNTSRLHKFIPSHGPLTTGNNPTYSSWVRLNRLRTGVGLFRSTMHKWGLVSSANCRCGANNRSYTIFLSPVPPSKRDT